MATFEYKAITNAGKTISGTIDGNSKDSATEALSAQGIKVIQIELSKGKAKHLGKVKLVDLVLFTRQLSTMVSAGVPLMRSLTTLQTQAENPTMKLVIADLVKEVESGAQLADALEKHPEVFTPIYINMVRAGEAAGIVDDILKRLATQVESSQTLRKKIKGAMTYPTVVFCIMIIAFFGIMIFIIPKIGEILKGIGGPDAELPALTAALLGISDFLIKFWPVIIGAAVGAGFMLRKFLKTEAGKRKRDEIILKLPIVGLLTTKSTVASFTRTFSALVGAGVSVVEALRITGRSLGNKLYEEDLEKAALQVINGKQMSEAIGESKLFPPIVSQMLAVGEETGQTDVVLVKVAEFYEEEVNTMVDSMSSLIEPLIMVVIGGGVAVIAAAVMGPIASISNSVGMVLTSLIF
ncbi:MAG: type II secretion system F family protein [Candidatus Saccharibacteria bacterium]|nr:type II secretion system F family protein [TM7 phylum sp. oral taxon 350]